MNTQSTKNPGDWGLYKRLLSYVLPLKWAFALSFLGFVLYACMDVLAVDILQYLIDSIDGSGSLVSKVHEGGILSSFLRQYLGIHDTLTVAKTVIPILMIIIAISRGLGGFIGNFFMKYVGNKVVYRLRNELFQHLNQLPMAYINTKNNGKLVSRITYNVEQVTGAVTNSLTTLFRDGLTVIGLFSYLIYVNFKLTLTFLIVIPVIAVLVNQVSKRFRRISHRLQNSMGDITQVVTEAVNSSQDMRVYGAQQAENERFQKVTAYTLKQRLKEAMTDAALSPTVQVLLTMSIALLVWVGLNSSDLGTLSAGSFVAYLVAAGAIAKPFRQVTGVLSVIQKALAAAQDIFSQMDEPVEQELGDKAIQSVKGDLRFDHVSFSYPKTRKKVLDDISFEVKSGEMLALVGESGGGKSTLAGLIPRFYNPTDGHIYLDGIATDSLSLENLRSHIALVSQNVVLTNDTIASNIAYGLKDKPSTAQIIEAAKLANAHEFIIKLAQSYDTVIGDNGVLLSGGQRQRIAIARAILKDAPLLILDEATSALDNESEQLIQAALMSIMKNRTTLVIAHRLSTIERADKILVIKDGRIIEQGNHASLMEQNAFYAKLHRPASHLSDTL